MIVVFDGHCLLCSRSVRFLLRHDRRGILLFASIQGAMGRRLLADAGLQPENLQTLLFVDEGRTWQQTAALLRIAGVLGWPWRAAWLAWCIPAPLRDGLYRLVARNRQQLFGVSATCMVPPPEQRSRFLN
jgi:predicted DCC family thiol-disulfide oxidoreductase YuxK